MPDRHILYMSTCRLYLDPLLLIPGCHAVPDKHNSLLVRNLMVNKRQWARLGQVRCSCVIQAPGGFFEASIAAISSILNSGDVGLRSADLDVPALLGSSPRRSESSLGRA